MHRIRPWREVRTESLLETGIFSVERSVAVSPADGTEHDFFRILSADWAQIVPVTARNEIVLIRTFRHGSQSVSLEVPGGLVEPGEAPAVTALRECVEETGYRGAEAVALGVTNPNPALFGNSLYSFCAFGVEPGGAIQNSATEETECVLVPVGELRGLLVDGTIDHALIAMTLWRFLDRYGR